METEPTHNETPRQRLRRLAEQRVGDMGMNLTTFQKTNRIGRGLWTRWRNNEQSVTHANDHRVHAALGWHPRSRADIIAGGDPTPVSGQDAPTLRVAQGGPARDPFEDRWLEEARRAGELPRSDKDMLLGAVRTMIDGLESRSRNGRQGRDGAGGKNVDNGE